MYNTRGLDGKFYVGVFGAIGVLGAASAGLLAVGNNLPSTRQAREEQRTRVQAVEIGSSVEVGAMTIGLAPHQNNQLEYFKLVPEVNRGYYSGVGVQRRYHSPAPYRFSWINQGEAKNHLNNDQATELFQRASQNGHLDSSQVGQMQKSFARKDLDLKLTQNLVQSGILSLADRGR